MPKCSLVHCGARKSIDQPDITLHKLPTNVELSKKWLKVIRTEDLNPNHNIVKICSLHFKKSCFNHIGGRLHSDAVPTLFLPREISKLNIPVLYEKIKETPKSRMPVLCITPKPDSSNSVVIESVSHDNSMQTDDEEVREEYLEDAGDKEDSSEDEVQEEYLEDDDNFNEEFIEEDGDSEKVSQENVSEEVTTRRVVTLEKINVSSEKSNVKKPTMSKLLEKRLILSEKYDLKEPIMSTMLEKILSKKPDSPEPSVSMLEKRIVPSEQPDVKESTVPIAAQQQIFKIREQADIIAKLKKRITDHKKNTKRLSGQIRRRDKKVATLESEIQDLRSTCEASLLLKDSPQKFDGFLKNQRMPKILSLNREHSGSIRKLAQTLNFLSPKAYEFIRNTYNKSLPAPNVLSNWSQSVNANEGSKVETLKNIWSEVKKTADKQTDEQSDPVTVLVVRNEDTENQIEI